MKIVYASVLILGISLISVLGTKNVGSEASPVAAVEKDSSNVAKASGASDNMTKTGTSVVSEKIHQTSTNDEKKPESVHPEVEKPNDNENNQSATNDLVTTTSSPPIPVPVTTTLKPNPTSTVAPSSGPGKWNVTKNNETCIVLYGEITIVLKNPEANNSDIVKVPSNAKASGNCDREQISLSFGTSNLTFTFAENRTKFYIKGVAGYVARANSTIRFANETLKLYETPLNQSYKCNPDKKVTITDKVNLTVSQFQIQAFKKSQTHDFDEAIDCEVFPHTPDIVPIIVGCALAILVILVLVAYLISRRRSQSQGYFSM